MPPFQYEAPAPNPFALTVADLIARQGDVQAHGVAAAGQAQAQAAANRGAIWARTIENASQIPGQVMDRVRQDRQLASIEAARGAETALTNEHVQALQRGRQGQQLLGQLVQQHRTTDPTLGTTTIDHDAVAADLAAAGYVPEAMQYLKGAADTAEDREKINGLRRQTNAAIALSVGRAAHGATDPDDFLSRLDHLAIGDAVPADTRQRFAQEVQAAGPEGWDALKKRYVDWADSVAKPLELKPGEKIVAGVSGTVMASGATVQKTRAELASDAANPNSPTAAQSAEALKKLEPTGAPATSQTHPMRLRGVGDVPVDYIPGKAGEPGKWLYNGQDVTGKVTAIPSAAREAADAAAADVTELTPAGLDAAALNYAKTGQLPPLGMGDKTTRKKIINRAAEMMPGLDVASARADYTANSDTLKSLVKQREALGAFESTALKNLDVFIDAAGKVADTGSPMLNRPIRAISEAGLGSAEMTAFQTARRTVIPEFAKILANPGLAGQLSDSARHEIEGVIDGSATFGQMLAAAKVLKTDTANRRQSYDDQIAGIRDRIKLGAPGAGGAVSVTAPNGKTYTFPTQADADAFKAKAGIK